METECIICGKRFQKRKTNKKTCSDKCRQKLHRYRERVDTIYFRMKDDISALAEIMLIEEFEKDVLGRLEQLALMIKALRM